MGILVPENCGIRVGDEVREWTEGGCIYFDSSYRHEVWNTSSKPRVCLMLDIFHPDLTAIEREVLRDLNNIVKVAGANPTERSAHR
jgi:aspartyl/asparaginyl beta-hydroxylase (cupin superfamily)